MIHGIDYHGFVYVWFDRATKKYCIGSHMGSVDDGYTSRTGWMHKAYRRRPMHFMRRIVHWHQTTDRNELFAVEQKWLDLIPDADLANTY